MRPEKKVAFKSKIYHFTIAISSSTLIFTIN